MSKCKACPRKKICRDECYGENPCDFAQAYDQLTRKVETRDNVIQRQRVELGGLRKCSLAEYSRMFGDYVLTPVQDAFTGKIGWWISKKGFTTARYCFTASDEKEVEYQIKNGLSGYMRLLDKTLGGAAMILKDNEIMRCPKCGGKEFFATAHVAQDWELDETGTFVKSLNDCVEVTHFPDADDIWDCKKCGFSAAGSEYITTKPGGEADG